MAAKKEETKKDESKKQEPKGESVREILEEGTKEAEGKTPSKEDKAKEEATKEKEDEKLEEKKEAEKPEIPLTEVIEKDRKEQKDKLRGDILETLGYSKDEQKKAKRKGFQTPWEERGEDKPATWDEAIKAGADLADYRRVEADKKVKAKEKKTQEVKNEETARINQTWDNEIETLETQGHIPKVTSEIREKLTKGTKLSPEEKKDDGLIARARLFTIMKGLHDKGEDSTMSLRVVYHDYFSKDSDQPAGADAPISGGSKAVSPPAKGFKYSDIKDKSIRQILQEGVDEQSS